MSEATDELRELVRAAMCGNQQWSIKAIGRLETRIRTDADTIARLEADLAAAREKVARWMIERSFATGHGDTLDDLLSELAFSVAEIRTRAEAAEAALAEAVTALEPFAKVSGSVDTQGAAWLRQNPGEGACADGMTDAELAELFAPANQVCLTDGSLRDPIGVTWDHLRRARAVVTKHRKDHADG
jgi:uncharacterized small protein (DUF1192 family)